MSDSASITLAIPCFNAAGFIGMALDSVNRQTVQPKETIVVDDGSTDHSADIIKKFPHVKRISHPNNCGIGAARNTAWKHATGNIIVFIDADTVAHPRLLEILIGCYRSGDVAGVGGRAIEIVQNSPYDRWRKAVLFQSWGKKYRADAPFLFGLCSSYRKNILETLQGFDPFFTVSGEDMDFSFRVHQAGFNLVYHPEAVVFHLRTDDCRSIKKMTYRHCYFGFLAQRKNRYYKTKTTPAHSLALFFKQVFVSGIAKGNIAFARLTILLHFIIFLAWLDSRRENELDGSKTEYGRKDLVTEGLKDVSGTMAFLNNRTLRSRPLDD